MSYLNEVPAFTPEYKDQLKEYLSPQALEAAYKVKFLVADNRSLVDAEALISILHKAKADLGTPKIDGGVFTYIFLLCGQISSSGNYVTQNINEEKTTLKALKKSAIKAHKKWLKNPTSEFEENLLISIKKLVNEIYHFTSVNRRGAPNVVSRKDGLYLCCWLLQRRLKKIGMELTLPTITSWLENYFAETNPKEITLDSLRRGIERIENLFFVAMQNGACTTPHLAMGFTPLIESWIRQTNQKCPRCYHGWAKAINFDPEKFTKTYREQVQDLNYYFPEHLDFIEKCMVGIEKSGVDSFLSFRE